jgi:hypothetical protein
MGLIVGSVLIVFQFFLGNYLLNWLDRRRHFSSEERCAAAGPVGLTATGYTLLTLLLLTQSWSVTIWVYSIAGMMLAVGILYRAKTSLNHYSEWFQNLTSFFARTIRQRGHWCLIGFLFLFCGLATTLLTRNGQGILVVNGSQALNDIAYHLNMVGRLGTNPFHLEHPVLSGTRLNYPFVINLLTAFFQRAGLPFLVAWYLPVLMYGGSIVFLLYCLGKRLFGNQATAVCLVAIVLFGGGLGFYSYLFELGSTAINGGIDQLWEGMVHYPEAITPYWQDTFETTQSSHPDYFWLTPAYIFFSMQRPFAGGFAITIILILGLLDYSGTKDVWRWFFLWALLPLLHTHTFISVSIIGGTWFLFDWKNVWQWVKGTGLSSVFLLPQVWYLMPHTIKQGQVQSFLKPWVGWMYCSHQVHWFYCDLNTVEMGTGILWFWSINFGFLFWAWVTSLLIYCLWNDSFSFRCHIIPFMVASLVLFLLPNLIKFQPWIFDNNKLLFYWWFFAGIVILLVVNQIPMQGSTKNFCLVILTLVLSLSGFIEIGYRIKNHLFKPAIPLYSTEDRTMARWIRRNTRSDARFLTGTDAKQYIPMLTGRSIYLGFRGWLWSQGKSHLGSNRRRTIRRYLLMDSSAGVCDDGLDYLLWNQNFRESYSVERIEELPSSLTLRYETPNKGAGQGQQKLFELEC